MSLPALLVLYSTLFQIEANIPASPRNLSTHKYQPSQNVVSLWRSANAVPAATWMVAAAATTVSLTACSAIAVISAVSCSDILCISIQEYMHYLPYAMHLTSEETADLSKLLFMHKPSLPHKPCLMHKLCLLHKSCAAYHVPCLTHQPLMHQVVFDASLNVFDA